MATVTNAIEVFYSYAREDEILRRELEKHLNVMQRQGLISGWHAGMVGAGIEWAEEISTHICSSHLILLLISPDFIASDDCYSIQMQQALKRHTNGDVRVVPILLRPVNYEGTPFRKLQALPTNGVPVTKWQDRDEAFVDIAREINKVVRYLNDGRQLLSGHEAKQQYQKQPLSEKETQSVTTPPLSSPDSVFLFNMELTAPNEFCGRVRQRGTLLSRTKIGASTSIVGPRRIGKTWLMSYLLQSASRELGPSFRIGYIDATRPSCSTLNGFVAEALKELRMPVTGSMGLDLAILENKVKELKARRLTPVLCIDEFEGFCEQQDFDLNILIQLRAITIGGLVLVLASKGPVIDIVVAAAGQKARTSPFFNVFQQLTLKNFNYVEAQEFVHMKAHQAGFTHQECALLLKYGQYGEQQWPPLRLQLVGQILQRDKHLAVKIDPYYYRPGDPIYWQEFEQELEETYMGVVG